MTAIYRKEKVMRRTRVPSLFRFSFRASCN